MIREHSRGNRAHTTAGILRHRSMPQEVRARSRRAARSISLRPPHMTFESLWPPRPLLTRPKRPPYTTDVLSRLSGFRINNTARTTDRRGRLRPPAVRDDQQQLYLAVCGQAAISRYFGCFTACVWPLWLCADATRRQGTCGYRTGRLEGEGKRGRAVGV